MDLWRDFSEVMANFIIGFKLYFKDMRVDWYIKRDNEGGGW